MILNSSFVNGVADTETQADDMLVESMQFVGQFVPAAAILNILPEDACGAYPATCQQIEDGLTAVEEEEDVDEDGEPNKIIYAFQVTMRGEGHRMRLMEGGTGGVCAGIGGGVELVR